MRFFSKKTRENNKITLFKALECKAKVFLSVIYSKLIPVVLLSSTLGLGIFAHAQFGPSTEVSIETMHVFPEVVNAEGWKNIETLLSQNIDESALYQDFNKINAAYFDMSTAYQLKQKIEANEVSENLIVNTDDSETVDVATTTGKQTTSDDDLNTSSTSPVQLDDTSEHATSISENIEPVEEVENVPVETPISEDITSDSEMSDEIEGAVLPPETEQSETVEPEPQEEVTAFKRIGNGFALVFDSVIDFLPLVTESTTTAVTTPDIAAEVIATTSESEVVIDDVKDLVVEDEVEIDIIATSTATAITTPVLTATTTDDVLDDVDDVATTTPVTETQEPIATSTSADNFSTTTNLSTETDQVLTVESCVDDCVPYVIGLSGFGLPVFEDNRSLSGAQLRLSFAAKRKATRDAMQTFEVWYRFGTSSSWENAGHILIDDEASNSINGGYYLFALPQITDPALLDDLDIELRYKDNPTDLENLFVESVWLELFTEVTEAAPLPTIADFENGFDAIPLNGDNLVLDDGTVVEFSVTDENENETLIIKSDKLEYEGFSKTTMYFNVTNVGDDADDFSIQTYFPKTMGTVNSLEEWNQNKPMKVVVPEFRPFVYHCEAGWEQVNAPEVETIDELSKLLLPEELPEKTVATSTEEFAPEVLEIPEPETDTNTPELLDEPVASTTVNQTLSTVEPLTVSGVTDIATTTSQNLDVVNEQSEEDAAPQYVCRDTHIVRECDTIEGENTACHKNNVKVNEEERTYYQGGWEREAVTADAPQQPTLLKKLSGWIGLGPDKKEVPDSFEMRSRTPDEYTIAAGETKYFKMEIEFPPFTSGEFWIEAVGSREYGLLDPFWSSDWQYRMPILIDNTDGKTALTEQQVFFELDSSVSDFWANVADDGGDIRFVQEVSVSNLYAATSSQFNNTLGAEWAGRVALTIPSSNVSAGITNFPVYVDLSTLGDDFWANVASDGSDIRVTTQNGSTEVALDVVEIDTVAQTGEIHFLAGTLNAVSDNIFHVYYDNPSATAYASTSPYGSQAVWSDYEAVYHFSDDPTTIGNVIVDHTGNGQELLVEGAALATTTGAMGTAIDLTGTTVGLLRDAGNDWAWTASDDHVSTGLYYQTIASNEAIWEWGTNNNPNWLSYMPWYSNASTTGRGYLYFGRNQNGTWARDIDVWHHFTTVAPSTIGDLHGIYDNAVLELSNTQSVTDPSNLGGLQVGRYTTGGSYNGYIDELRFASDDAAYSAGRVAAEHLNHTDPATFYATSTAFVGGSFVEGWFSTSWNNRQKITIPIGSGLTDFPVYVDLSTLGDDFFANVAADGSDIRVTTASSKTELPYELVNIDTGAKTGELYFKADLSSLEDSVFYIYFNNPDATAYGRTHTYGSENVWTNGFLGVYHFEEDAAGTGNVNLYKDSTSNEYDGDDETTSNDTSGKLGAGVELGDDANDHIILPHTALDGQTDLTVSWWHQTDVLTDQAILSGANSGQFNELWLRLDNSNLIRYYDSGAQNTFDLTDTVGTYNNDAWQHFMITGDDAADETNLYVNGAGDTENPDPLTIDALSIDSGGLIVGQDQDSVGGGFSDLENFDGQLDELRLASVVRTSSWAEREYANQNTPGSFYATSTVEALQITDFQELDFWVQHFSTTTDEADIWVQVDEIPAGESALIYLYYGSSGAVSASDEYATFTYSTSTDLYYVVDDSGAEDITIQSHIDNNLVAIDGGTPVALNEGEPTTFSTFTGSSVISALGPISATVSRSSSDNHDIVVPISFATSSYAIPTNRNANRWYIYSPFASTSVQTYIGSSGTADQSFSVATGTTATATADPAETAMGTDGDGVVIEASAPVLVTHRSTTPGDGFALYPPTTRDLFGINSNHMMISALAGGADPTLYCSAGAGGLATTTSRGETAFFTTSCTAASQGNGSAVRVSGQASAVVALQEADGDGREATTYWPQHEFGTRYFMTNNSAYAAVVCSPRFGSVTLEVQDSSGGTIETGSCTPSGNNPGKAYFGSDGTTLAYTAGAQVVATNGVPFYVIYEDDSVDNDEKNILGSVQARKYGAEYLTYEFGAQEIANDAEYEQRSFAWYQNADNQTPTTTWALGASEFVSEGDAITGSGAVDDGDVLRLRMSLAASNATGTEDSVAFKLQYASAASGQCSSATSWYDVGELGSTTAAFSGYNNSNVGDGTTLATTTLASSTVLGTYEERNVSDFIPNDIPVGDIAEWDWVITATNVGINTNYCFRMVRAPGSPLTTYTAYPELETVGPPNTPTLLVYFDNERANAFDSVLSFTTTDIASDDIHYQVQIDEDINFGSVDVDRNSDDNFLEFENLNTPSDKAPFNSGEQIRFTSPTTLSATSTYWWRVRASDPTGSATTSAWSAPFSFSTDGSIVVSEWHQTTGDQFTTNTLSSLTTGAGAVSVSGSSGTMTSTAIDFDDATVGNAWGEISWNDTETTGTILYQIEYNDNGSWTLVPDSAVPDNSTGTGTSPINILELDTDIYNEIRLIANFSGTSLSVEDWTVTWGQRVETPVLGDPFDNEKISTTLPIFDFISSDPQGDDLEYEISWSADYDFLGASTTHNTNTDPGFTNQIDGGDTDPFTSGDTIAYTTQAGEPFTNSSTYWWKARAKDPAGGNAWSPWSDPDSFTVDTGISVSTWFQTTQEQFSQGTLTGLIASTSDSVAVTDIIGEYGTKQLVDNDWTLITTTNEYNNMVVVASPEYAAPTYNLNRNPRVRNKTSNSFEIKVDNYTGAFTGSTTVDYIVMEAGTWDIDDGGAGVQVVAGTETAVSEVQADNYSPTVGTVVTFASAFDFNPAALLTVSSNSDSSWVATHVDGDGADHNVEVVASKMRIALARSLETSVHGAEDIDYVVFDIATGTNDGTIFQSFNTTDAVDDTQTNSGSSQSFPTSFATAPPVTVVHNNAEDGGNGAFALKDLSGTQNASSIFLSTIEGGAGANQHTQEVVSVVAFEDASGSIVRTGAASYSGSIASEDIIFSDGTGPKFNEFAWTDTTPGTSDITYQVEYKVSEDVYALIPDGVITDNSLGTTTSPIDLTAIDINTYDTIRLVANFVCSAGDCPELHDWQVTWSEGVDMSGTLQEYDRVTNVLSGTIRAAVNGTPVGGSGSVSGGTWTLSNVTAFEGDIVTVWVDGAAESDEAVAAFVYDGLGDITGVALYEQHLSFDADENGTTTNELLASYDNSVSGDEDIFFDVDAFGNLTVCAVGVCPDANLYIGAGNAYVASSTGAASVSAHDMINNGTIELDANTFNFSGSWINNATSSTDTATVNLTASTTNEVIVSTESPTVFYNMSLGSGVATSSFTISEPMDFGGNFTVASTTFYRDGYDITLAGSLTTGSGGVWSGEGTTTFDGAGVKTWSDTNPVTQNVGNVIIDGASTFVTVTSNVGAYDITIGGNDTLAGGTANTIYVAGDWTNGGTFNSETSNVEIIPDDRIYPPIVPGSADWYADTSFADRVPVVIDDTEVPGDLTNFPIYVDLATLGGDFWDSVQTNGSDIRITAGDGQTEVPYEIVSIDSIAQTGELHFLAPSVSGSATTTFYVYHNNATATGYVATDPYGSEAVWVGYEAVYHFNDDPTVVANVITDSTAFGRDLAVETEGLATTTGAMGLAVDLYSSTGFLRDADYSWTAGDLFASSGWYQMDIANTEAVWAWGTASTYAFMPWWSGTTGYHRFGTNAGDTSYSYTPRTTSWHHFTTLAATTSGASNYTYHNAILRDTSNQPTNNPAAGPLQVGRYTTAGSLEGSIDELRFATSTRSTDWIQAEYNNQKSAVTFYATSSVETYVPDTIIDEATHVISSGGSAFFDITFDDATTSQAFSEPSVVVNGDFTIATGTVALPTGKLTVGGSFLNSGVFMHNNNEVEFSASGAETITLGGTEYLNHFYDVTFDGSGSWNFTDSNATTSNDFIINDGTVTFPSDTLNIAGTLTVSGGGFDANNGTVYFTSIEDQSVTTSGSSFNHVVFGAGGGALGWYNSVWDRRLIISIASTSVTNTLTDFPVFLDLGTLGDDFWDNTNVDAGDVRITSGDGETELPYEIVEIDSVNKTGELHFLADSVSDDADNTFYLYYDNPAESGYASTSPYGSQAVWRGYEAVYHFTEDPTVVITDVTGRGKDLSPSVGTAATTSGHFGTALDTTNLSTMLEDSDWVWSPGDDLISSGWYFQNAADTGALWQFGDGSVVGTYLAFMPWYTGTTGYHRFGNTSGDSYAFARDNSVWHHFTTIGAATQGESNLIYEDTVLRDTVTQSAGGANPTNTGLKIGRYQGSTYMDIHIDELRFATSTRSTDWIDAEYLNQYTPTAFYGTSTQMLSEAVATFILDETDTDADGDVSIQYVNLQAPSSNFTIGGSALNTGGAYNPNNATTTFDSTDTGETVAFGDGAFFNLAFDGIGGGWDISTTTVTNNALLVTGADFTLATGTTMTVGGVFSNTFAAPATNWTNSTLLLTGGDYTVTDRLDSGDDYATVGVSGDTDIVIWNSTISTSTISDTSSIYMPDYGTADGLLHIYGDYDRTSGTEYWNYATDFDGTDLTGGSNERIANVRVASSSRVTISGAGHEAIGIPTASTTVDSLSGRFALITSTTTLSTNNVTVTGTDGDGWQLLDGTSVNNMTNIDFVIASGTSAITVDADTINAQPSQTYGDINFSSVTGSSFNVTASGTPNGYWLFTSGVGDRYGEAFDNDDGDPGSIQWDDSNYDITISGTVYADDGVTPASAPVCNGSTEVVTVVVDGTTTFTAPCDASDGSYSVPNVTYAGEPKLVTYINSEATETQVNVSVYDELTGSGSVAANTITVTRPNVINDSVLVVMIGKDDDIVINPPVGWTEIATLGNTTGDDIRTTAWYRVVADAGTEGASYDFSTTDNGEGYSYWIASLVNVDTVTPIDVASSWTKYQNDVSPSAPTLTTVTNGALVLASWYAYFDNNVTLPFSGWDVRAGNVVGGENSSFNVVSKLMTTAGASGATDIYNIDAGRESHAGQFAFRPASAPTATGTMVAATVTQTPLGAGATHKTIMQRDQRVGFGTVATAANIVVDTPSIENGDVLVAILGKEDEFDITAPAGWIKEDDLGETAGSDVYSGIWYKIITNAGGEPASYNFVNNDTGTEEFTYWIGSFENVDTTNVFDVTSTWSNIQDTSAPTAPSITTVTNGAYVLASWVTMYDNTMTMPGAPWTTLAEDLNQSSRAQSVVGRTVAVAGPTGGATATDASADDANVGQFALRPAPLSVADEITDMDLYGNRVIVRHEDIIPISIADMALFDNDDDSDIPFTAATAGTDTLTVLSGSGLAVWKNKEFIPRGIVTLSGVGATPADGSLLLSATSTYTSTSTNPLTVGGSFYVGSGASYDAASSTVTFTATNLGQSIDSAASSTVTFYDLNFNGVGGNWAVQTPIVSLTDIDVATGTVSGVSDITVETGSFAGNGLVDMTDGTTLIKRANTLGGTQGWLFNNLTLGDGINGEITTPASNATTTVRDTLTIATAHFLDAGASVWNLSGAGNVFVEDGTFLEDTSTVRYSGVGGSNIRRTPYYNLVIDAASGSPTYLAPATSLQVFNNLSVGATATSTLDINANDAIVSVGGDTYIAPLGTISASDSSTLRILGDWDNDGIFTANGGLVSFEATGPAVIAAGNSLFADVEVIGLAGTYTFTESATTTGYMTISSLSSAFTQSSGTSLAVGGVFTNSLGGANTTWTGSTLHLFGGVGYEVSTKSVTDVYNDVVVSNNTHPRMWNSSYNSVTTTAGSSLYSRDHDDVAGDLYIYGDYRNNSFNDYWSYAEDFDGASLTGGSERQAAVYIENGGSVYYTGGSLTVLGTTTASTTIEADGVGTYAFTVGGTTSSDMQYYAMSDMNIDGLVFAGTPTVTDISHGAFTVAIDGGSAMTVGGTVINTNQAQNYTGNNFATTTAISAYNVTATGTSVSSWRFVNVTGNLGGEAKDNDPGGDPGYVVWEDSAAIINISGTVYSDEGSSVSTVCDSTTNNIFLSMDGLSFASTTCNGDGFGGGTGVYTFTGINYGASDTVTVYIDGEAEQAATVSKDPVSSIGNMDLYENRVIVRHESGASQTIADMAVWDSSDDADIPFTAVDAGTDSLTIPSDFKLIVWNDKDFDPGGNVTVSGGGAGAAHDGTVELYSGATYNTGAGEVHTIGGSLLTGSGALYDASTATTTFTTTGAGRTIDLNENPLYNVSFTGSGSWTITDGVFDAENVLITNGTVTLPSATTTISGSFRNTAGAFDANGGILVFDATSSGNLVTLGGSDASTVLFDGSGGAWTIADTNATTTNSFTISTGSVVLPSGRLSIGGDLTVVDTLTHNSGTVALATSTGAHTVSLSGNDLYSLQVIGDTSFTITDTNATLLGDLTVATGTLLIGDGTFSIGGSLDATGGVLDTSTSTVFFNSGDTGETIASGDNAFYNLLFGNVSGGWTFLGDATTTNNFTLTNANTITFGSGNTFYVGNVFTNNVGGAATDWSGSTLILDSGTEYETNVKGTASERYEILVLGAHTDISTWNASATTTTVASTSSLYSQDHGGVDGSLYIYGDYHIGTTTEYWNYATDFDGVALGGSSRSVTVSIQSGATTTVDGGSLQIIGASTATTTIMNQGSGQYEFVVTAGTFNAEYYAFEDLNSDGLQFTGAPTISSLNNGSFEQALNTANMITLASTSLNANASLIITGARFVDGGFTGGVNVSLDATTTNSWLFTAHTGNLAGEAFDVDGSDDCSSIRWDDSQCLLTEQAHYRWRNDDGGEGASDATWYDTDWSVRKRVRVINDDATTYTDVAVKVGVVYDSDMQTDFEELRFTDSSGTTTIPHWIERYTTGVSADVWVQVPSLAASEVTELYMYYGNVTATSTSTSSPVFTVSDTFDDNNITEYSGDTTLFNTAGTFAYGGGYGLDTAGNESLRATDGIFRFDQTVSQGEIFRYVQYIDTTTGSADEACTLFGVQSPGTTNQNYGVCLELFGTDRIVLAKDVESTDTYGGVSVLGTKNVTYTTGWYEVQVDWQTDDTIDVSLYTAAGTLVATTSATDASYSSGGFGFTYWGFNGGWDSAVSWPRTDSRPTVQVGAEQSDGGATWAAAQDTAVGGFAFGDTARLRVGIENTGLPIENQNFRLEFAPKLTAPSCEAVSAGDYSAVPPVASCGASAVCMTSTSTPTNGDATTDHLVTDAGTFVVGEFVADTSNQTTNIDVAQNEYTELEYALTLTTNAINDAYCFRVTDSGNALDSYALIPELTLAFSPVMGTVTLNGGLDIVLGLGGTTTILATTTVTDLNGYTDITTATTTFYRTAVGASCTANDNSCYISTSTCSFVSCSGNSCDLSCAADFYYHADPTDVGTYAGEEWFAFMEVEDSAGSIDFGTSIGTIELTTIRGLDVVNEINYGTLGINDNTGSFNPTTTVMNLGNEAIDVRIVGTDLTDGGVSSIPAAHQLMATSTFTYDSCVGCSPLSVSGTDVEVDLSKPTTYSPPIEDVVYWGIEIPLGTASNAHTGNNLFYAISD